MSLSYVMVTEAVAGDCFLHALTTEREEVMGLLLGDIQIVSCEDGRDPSSISREEATRLPGARKVARVWGCRVLNRSDKRPDRVEIPPELMCNVTDEVEEISKATGQSTRVIGWYHSHPNITPYPSHVDLGTQGMYQMIETGWVGLIFSVFHQDRRNNGRLEVHCFQTHVTPQGANEHIKVPLGICRSDVLLPPSVASAFPPLSQCSLLTDVLITESKQNLESVIDQYENDNREDIDDELRAVLNGVYQQQLFKLKHSFLVPTLQSGMLLNGVLAQRESVLESQVKALEAEEADLKALVESLKKEKDIAERGIDALLTP